jgi:hypothetical protein
MDDRAKVERETKRMSRNFPTAAFAESVLGFGELGHAVVYRTRSPADVAFGPKSVVFGCFRVIWENLSATETQK